jgi:methylated-DNA-[protein]-cysteine S-methyltransferase
VRAVGTACATNPVPIVVPCHRVLPASGRLGAYGGGPERKRVLLALEGASVRDA